jgi:hypothetical protein
MPFLYERRSSCIPLEHNHSFWAVNVLLFNHIALQHRISNAELLVF